MNEYKHIILLLYLHFNIYIYIDIYTMRPRRETGSIHKYGATKRGCKMKQRVCSFFVAAAPVRPSRDPSCKKHITEVKYCLQITKHFI